MIPFSFRWAASTRVSGYFVAIFLVHGTYLPFFPVFLAASGFSEAQIGLIIAAPMVVRILATPATAILADRLDDRRRALILYSFGSLVSFSLVGLVAGFLPVLLVIAAMAIFWTALLPLSDALAVAVERRDGANYGRMRLWGSLSFIAVNLAAGAVVEARGPGSVYPMLVAGMAVLAVMSVLLPTVKRRPAADEGAGGSALRLLARPAFVLALLAAGLSQASHAFLYGFGSLTWQELGFSGGEIGTLWAVGVISEVVLFWASARVLGRLGPLGLLALGAIAGMVRWTLLPLMTAFPAVFVVQMLHGITFGATHLGMVHVVAQWLPERLASTGQGLAATAVSAAMAVMVMASGPLYHAFGAYGYLAMALLSTASLVLVVLSARIGRATTAATG